MQITLLSSAARTGSGSQTFAMPTTSPLSDASLRITVTVLGTATLTIDLKEWNKGENGYTSVLPTTSITATGDTVVVLPISVLSDKIELSWTQVNGGDVSTFSVVLQGKQYPLYTL